MVCLYRRPLWHRAVASGNLRKQNGTYKMALVKGKEELIKKKLTKMIKPTIELYEIIVIINQAWAHYFICSRTNKKSTANRGWYPLNCNVLLTMTLRATMAGDDKDKEDERGLVPTTLLPTPISNNFTAPPPQHLSCSQYP